MKVSNIITLALTAIALGLAYYLGNSIYQEQQKFKLIKVSEAQIKDNLKGLREAQLIHKRKYNRYAKDWTELHNFISNDSLVLIDKREEIIPRQYEKDSIIIIIDTLKTIAVTDSLFHHDKYPTLDRNNLQKVPLRAHDFVMKVTNDTLLDSYTLYIADEKPLDAMRRKPIIRNDKVKRIKGTKPLLTIGSTIDESLKASWSK